MPQVRLACSRRHSGRPPVLVHPSSSSHPSLPPVCLPCAAAVLRDSSTPAARLGTCSAIACLAPGAIYAAVALNAGAAAVALDVLDALCATLRAAADGGDAGLTDAVAEAVGRVCFGGDGGGEEREGKRKGGGQGLRFCSAVTTHAFAVLGDCRGKGKKRIRAAYMKLLSCMLHGSGVLDVGSLEGEFKVAFLHALKSAVVAAPPDCETLLADAGEGHFEAVPHVVDMLCVLVAADVEVVAVALAEQFMNVVSLLRRVIEDAHREKLLTLLSMILPSDGDVDFVGREVESVIIRGDDQEGAQKSDEALMPGIALAEALKPCVISSCPLIRSRVASIVLSVVGESEDGSGGDGCAEGEEDHLFESEGRDRGAVSQKPFADLFSASAGFIDYLFEALRVNVKSSTLPAGEHEQTSLSTSALVALSLPILRMLAGIAAVFPDEMKAKWGYGLPIIISAPEATQFNDSLCFYVFDILRRGKCSLPVFSEAIGREVIQLVIHTACTGQNEAAHRDSGIEAKSAQSSSFHGKILESGISLLDELLSARKIKATCSLLLLDVAECSALMTPSFEPGLRVSRKLLALILDEAQMSCDSGWREVVEKIKHILLGVCGNVIIGAFSDPSAAELPSSFLAEGLQVLASSLDPRLFTNDEKDHDEYLRYFWQHLPPSLIYSRFADNVESDSVPRSSELWGSSGFNETDVEEGLISLSTPPTTSSMVQHRSVKVYLAQLCLHLSCSPQALTILNVNSRAIEECMPHSHTMLLNALSHGSSTELSSALLLVQCSEMFDPHQSFEAVFRSLVGRADSESILLPDFRHTALPLSRVLFSLGRKTPSLKRDVELCGKLCDILFSSPYLRMADEDQDLIMHVLNFHDTELRTRAWSVLAESRIQGDPSWDSLLLQLVELIRFSTPAAKCFVSTCFEGPQHVRELAIDLSLVDSKAIMPALIKVGLPSIVICVIERRQALRGTYDSLTADGHGGGGNAASISALQNCEASLAELVNLLTNGIARIDADGIFSLYRLLMLLVDVFVDLGKRGYSNRASNCLDLSILRCLAAVLNFSQRDKDTKRGFILDYVVQTNVLSLLQKILVSESNDDFLVGAAACVLDYTVRHVTQACTFSSASESNFYVWSHVPVNPSAWTALLQQGNVVSKVHAINCRRTAVLHLLKSIVIWCSRLSPEDPANKALQGVFDATVLVHILSTATSPSLYVRSAAQGVLTALLTNQSVAFQMTRLSTCRGLQKFLTAAWITSKGDVSLSEAQFLIGALLLQDGALTSHREVYNIAIVLGTAITVSKPQTAHLKTIAGDCFRAVASFDGRPSKRVGLDLKAALKDWQRTHSLDSLLQRGKEGTTSWDPTSILIGANGIIASQLRDTEL